MLIWIGFSNLTASDKYSRVEAVKTKKIRFGLATQTLRKSGCKDLGDDDIQNMVLAMAKDEAVPGWRMKVTIHG